MQDANEPGLDQVQVELLDSNMQSTNPPTVQATASGGKYRFTGLCPGYYYVRFTRPPGFVFTEPDQGGDEDKDSDANKLTGKTAKITLLNSSKDTRWDAGLVPVATLGDRVWHDGNGNGIQDEGEPGIAGVPVRLYDCSDNFIKETATDIHGRYVFTDLEPGSYKVVFVQPATGYSGFSPQYAQGSDGPEFKTNDADSNANATGTTDCIPLSPGQNNPTVDAGLVPATASLGDFVWTDTNANGLQDPGEPGLPRSPSTCSTAAAP